MPTKVLYIQYNNPGAYPPLINSARIFEELGWQTTFIGLDTKSTRELVFPESISTRVSLVMGKTPLLRFVNFHLKSIAKTLFYKPDVLYISDESACFAGVLASLFSSALVIYHEHDYTIESNSLKSRVLRLCRNKISSMAGMIVVPSHARAEASFTEKIKAAKKIEVVFNCPALIEIKSSKIISRTFQHDQKTRLYYHGSLVPARLPQSLLEAIAKREDYTLNVAGYFTEGSGATEEIILQESSNQKSNINYFGPKRRDELSELMQDSDIGLCILPEATSNINERHMAGASNKAFDYLANGLFVICPDTLDWRSIFSETPKVAFLNPHDKASLDHCIDQLRKQNQANFPLLQDKIFSTWNYEAQFKGVLTFLYSKLALTNE